MNAANRGHKEKREIKIAYDTTMQIVIHARAKSRRRQDEKQTHCEYNKNQQCMCKDTDKLKH